MSTKVKDANISMFHFGASTLSPSTSAFCLKLETYFRMANINYSLHVTTRGSSKGKLPYITHKGTEIADSTFIIEYLKKNQIGSDLNANLSPSEKGIALAFKRLSEENLYWVAVYQRWIEENGNFVKTTMPMAGIKKKLFPIYLTVRIKPLVKANLQGQGIGRHSKEEIYDIGFKDLTAISDFLGDKAYLMGEEPSEVDASIFGVVAQMVFGMPGSEHEKYIKEKLPNLVAYCERMKEKYWPDWSEACFRERKPVAEGGDNVEEKQQNGEVNGEKEEPQNEEDNKAKENGTGDADEEESPKQEEQAPDAGKEKKDEEDKDGKEASTTQQSSE